MTRIWIDLAPYWPKLRTAADARDNQKKGFTTSAYWNSDSHFLGLLAEQVYAIVTNQTVNLDLIVSGDGGSDFPDTDIKGVKYWADPVLKEHVDRPLRSKKYVLVGIDIQNRRGYVAGWASKEDILNAPIKDWGYGDRYSIPCTKLRPLLDTDMTEYKEKRKVRAPIECVWNQYALDEWFNKCHENLQPLPESYYKSTLS